MGETDTISRQAAIDKFEPWLKVDGYSEGELNMLKAVLYELRVMPSAQPEIVACGDCIHWICHDRRCGYWNHGVKPLDWCCHAERRTNG